MLELPGLRETFQLLDDPDCTQLGRQSWCLIAIVVTELLICIKFGWATITQPLPRHIALWWVLGAFLLLAYTVIKVKISSYVLLMARIKTSCC